MYECVVTGRRWPQRTLFGLVLGGLASYLEEEQLCWWRFPSWAIQDSCQVLIIGTCIIHMCIVYIWDKWPMYWNWIAIAKIIFCMLKWLFKIINNIKQWEIALLSYVTSSLNLVLFFFGPISLGPPPGSQEHKATRVSEAHQLKDGSHTTASDPQFGKSVKDMPR